MDISTIVRQELERLAKDHLDERVKITFGKAKLDSSRIKDYPLLRGKEVLVKADFRGCKGEAFTSNPMEFEGSIREVLACDNNAVIIATLNAVMRYLGLIDRTEHCSGKEPEICAKEFCEMLKREGYKKIGIIGYQPAFIKEIASQFGADNVIASDLNEENVGKVKHGVRIIHGNDNEFLIKNSDVVLVTGSTIVNGTFDEIYELGQKHNKRLIFYGTTIAGVAKLLNLDRFCLLGR
jgi:hypothetical protein